MAEPEKPKFKIEGSTSTTTQSALELIKNETDVTEHKLDAAIDDAAKQKVAEKIEKRVQEAKDKYKKGEGEIILITKEKLANFRKQINIEAKDSDEVVGTTNPSDTGTPKLSDTEITETIKTHLEENGTPVTPTETPPAPPESATTPAPSPETPTTPARPQSAIGSIFSNITGGLFGGGLAVGSAWQSGGIGGVWNMIVQSFKNMFRKYSKGFEDETSEKAFDEFFKNLDSVAQGKINTLLGSKWWGMGFNDTASAATIANALVNNKPANVSLKDLARALNSKIAGLTNETLSADSIVALIDEFKLQKEQEEVARRQAQEQQRLDNEKKEAEGVLAEYPLNTIKNYPDIPGIDFIRISDKTPSGYSIIIRDTNGEEDKYCKETLSHTDLFKKETLKAKSKNAKKKLSESNFSEEEKKILCRADLKQFLADCGDNNYFIGWKDGKNDEKKHDYWPYRHVKISLLPDLQKSLEKAVLTSPGDAGKKKILRQFNRIVDSVKMLDDGTNPDATLAQLNGDASPAPAETQPVAPASNPAEDAEKLARYPLADVMITGSSPRQYIRISGADTEGKYTFVVRNPSDSGDTYAKVRLLPGQLSEEGLKVLDKIQYTNIRNNRNYLEGALTPTERAQLARADIRNLLFNRKDFDYKSDAGDSKKYGEVTIGQLPDLLRFIEKGISHGKDADEKQKAALGKVLVERIMLNLDQLKSTLGSEADNTTLNQIDGPSSSPEITPTPAEAAENEKIKNYPLETVKRIEGTKSDCIRISEKNASGKYTCIIRNSEGSNDTYAKIELNADEFNKTRLTEEVAKATTVQDSFLFGLRPPESTALIKAEFKNFYEKQTQEYRDTLKILKLRDSTTGYFFTRKLRESADGIVKNERNLRTQENAKESIGLIDRFISGSIYGNFYALVGGLREAEEVTLEDFYNLITNS